MLDHANLIAMCRGVIDALAITSADHSLLILPLFHVNGIVISTLSPLLAGGGQPSPGASARRRSSTGSSRAARLFLRRPNDLHDAVRTARRGEAGHLLGAVRHLRCRTASVELLEQFESRYGIPIIEGYGLSEGTCASTVNPLTANANREPWGAAARPNHSAGGRQREPVADGEAGEVVIKGANVMRGYLNRPEETAKTIVDGWLHTGDVGRFDEDGYLVLVDRAKDMIIRGGENIYPREIEAVLTSAADRRGRRRGPPDPVYGEEPVLFVSLHPDKHLTSTRSANTSVTHSPNTKCPLRSRSSTTFPRTRSVRSPTQLRRRLAANPLTRHKIKTKENAWGSPDRTCSTSIRTTSFPNR